jgi:predicted Zn-dependent protease
LAPKKKTRMKFNQLPSLLGLIFICSSIFGQISSGSIPQDFIVKTSDKVNAEMQKKKENLTQREQRVFLEGIHYGIDELLQSGLVIYGDEVSKYVSQVADKLLESNSKLRKQLRFYTLRSNVTNAFSTDQGIIFVTTGLISQLTNEAQLAYILAHEISHYTEKHVVESFEYRTRSKGLSKQITQLATYSKEKEYQADLIGLELYNKAGYTIKEATNVFDVLMYSYLPIDEVVLPKTYFNSPLCYVPESLFSETRFEIKAEEDYDDSRSSHPNVRNRKEKAMEKAKDLKNWGNTVYFLGQEKFEYIRNITRFERVRNDMINARYADVLYTLFILEKQFPQNQYLTRMKAQAWYGLATYKNANDISQTILNKSDWEGEGAAMHYFIKQLSTEEILVLAMRNVEDCRKLFPDDQEIKVLWPKTVKQLHESKNIKLDNFHDYNFEVAVQKYNEAQAVDTMQVVEEKTELSKYEKIKKKKNNTDPTQFDSTLYFLYNLSDVVVMDAFKKEWKKLEVKRDEKDEADKKRDQLSRKDREKLDKKEADESLRTDLSEFILVEPAAISYSKGKVNFTKSEELQEKYTESFNSAATRSGLKVYNVDKNNLQDLGTDGFNQKSLFTSLLIQVTKNDDVECFPVDYSLINEIKAKYGTGKLVFTIVEHSYSPSFNASAIYLFLFPPAIPGVIAFPFIIGNQTEINVIVLDTEKAEIVTGARYFFKEPTNKFLLEGRLYDILNNLNNKK